MAYTKIFAVRDSLSRIVGYAANPEKTSLRDEAPLENMVGYALNPDKTATEQHLFESAINCASPATAYDEMKATKEYHGKKGGVLGYHVIQSFAPGEVTPQQAHDIGVEFARSCFGDRFEVVVGTHLDKGHLHSHMPTVWPICCVSALVWRHLLRTFHVWPPSLPTLGRRGAARHWTCCTAYPKAWATG